MTEGLLQEIPLDGVIQLMTLGGGTGELELVPLLPPHQAQTRVPVGHLFFREGALHAAFLADRAGEAVMKTLFLWEAGFFTWTPRDAQAIPPANIMMDTALVIPVSYTHLRAHETPEHLACVPLVGERMVPGETTPAAGWG